MTLIEDSAPKLNKGEWRGAVTNLDLKDRRLGWMTSLDDSVRVIRFTVVLADGRTSVLDQAVSYPGLYKAVIRKALGADY